MGIRFQGTVSVLFPFYIVQSTLTEKRRSVGKINGVGNGEKTSKKTNEIQSKDK